MKKFIDLETAHEWLGIEKDTDSGEKKLATAERKKLKELQESHPIQVELAFSYPWWCVQNDGVE